MNGVLTLAAILVGQATVPSAPLPLIVGVVRDQNGDPISGANVQAGAEQTRTGDDGTFAIDGSPGQSVRITCAYCRAASLIAGGDPLVVIVRRYEAVSRDGPSPHDLARLPEAHAESLISLRPFQLVNDASRVLPGPRVADRGDAYHGAPVNLDEVPLYDIATDLSPLLSAPAYGVRDLFFAPRSDAYRNGDQSGAGYVDIRSDDYSGIRAVAGPDLALQFSGTNGGFDYSGSTYSNNLESRNYAHAATTLNVPQGHVDASFIVASNTLAPISGDYAQTSNIGAHLQYENTGTPLYATLSAAQGSYNAAYAPATVASDWSDVDLRVGVQRATPFTRSFLEAATRFSAGSYNSYDSIAGTLTTSDITGGYAWTGSRFDAEANAGVYSVRSSAFSGGDLYPANVFVLPSLGVTYRPNASWSASVHSGGTYALASLLERLNINIDTVPVVRESGDQLDVTYGDNARVTATVTALRVKRSGVQRGTLSGSGVSSSWQITPELALRSWIYRIVPGITFDARAFTFDAPMRTATAASTWLTYENGAQDRLDVFYRRSLMDWIPYEHVDATFSAPLTTSLRWFVSSEDRRRARYVNLGVQFDR
ncbi:MAG: carboxypeptidase regulatory-like domain-containing protein [Candidatus Eremiobacteraeota bacterium]|nr:carboxypeptidase regulatory-like domain-containing protein [Candidatus Eremiobacteraeota bacterium]